nr:MAG TPA: hypothetical protein [Caudoviricetes sp.]
MGLSEYRRGFQRVKPAARLGLKRRPFLNWCRWLLGIYLVAAFLCFHAIMEVIE